MGLYGDFTEGPQPMPEPRGALRMRIWDKRQWLELRGPTDCSVWTEAEWELLLGAAGAGPAQRGSTGEDDGADRQAEDGDRTAADGSADRLRARQYLSGGACCSGCGSARFARAARLLEAELRTIWKDALQLMPLAMVDRRIVTTRPADRPHKSGEALKEEAHYVYRRAGRPCFICGTEVRTQVMAGRNLFWCPSCQAT